MLSDWTAASRQDVLYAPKILDPAVVHVLSVDPTAVMQ